ncbi:MAG: DUF4097 family beta strand repeat-containing protein [Myxococcota bacterium]
MLLLFATLAAHAGVSAAHPAARSARHEVPLGDARITLAEIDAGAGSLDVRGVPGLDKVQVTGTAWASNDALLAQIDVQVTCRDDRVTIRTVIPDTNGREEAGVDLVVELPPRFSATIDDGSGDLSVTGIAGVDLDDGSGNAVLTDLSGPVRIDDGSGDLRIERVAGPVSVEDGSGDLRVREVSGPVSVDDGSGDVDLAQIAGSVEVDDGSGDIALTDVQGAVVLHDGSGARRITRVLGPVTVDED